MTNYHKRLERELSGVLGMIEGTPSSTRDILNKYAMDVFCRGAYAGLHNTSIAESLYPLDMSTLGVHTVDEYMADLRIICECAVLGYTMGSEAHDTRNTEVVKNLEDAARYISKKLGCEAYCDQALPHILGPQQNSPDNS